MSLTFTDLNSIDLNALTRLLNSVQVRTHLVDHPEFTEATTREWVASKLALEASGKGRIKAVLKGGQLAGWCGVQPDEQGCELALVLAPDFWGIGPAIFRQLMIWAGELGHQTARIHLLETRKDYKTLRRMADSVCETELMGRKFTTYELNCQVV